MNTVTMTAEELREYEAFKAQRKEQEEKAQKEAERATYKEMVNDAVEKLLPELEKLSALLSSKKVEVYDTFHTILEMKASVYGVSENQVSHSFTNEAKTQRIVLGYHQVDNYDDTVNVGIGKVYGYIESLAKDAETRVLVNTILRLLQKDGKSGQLKASKVMQLRTMANESRNAEFIDGVNIIEKAYAPTISKQYVRAERKNNIGEWVNIPLGMTEA